MTALERLHAELAGGDELLVGALRKPGAEGGPDPARGPARLAACGPRAAAHRAEYELLVDAIYEGYLLHYEGRGRVVVPSDPDLALLLGDQLFAFGLARLAELGDLEAVAELGDVISLSAQARAAGNRGLAEAVWRAGAAAVGWGSGARHRAAKELARTSSPEAERSLLTAARQAQDHSVTG